MPSPWSLLMTPAPLHRIVYDGVGPGPQPQRHPARARRHGAALALELVGELYVVLARIGGGTVGVVTAVVAILAFLGAWFGYPLLVRRNA